MPISVHKAFSSSNIFASLFMIHPLKDAFYSVDYSLYGFIHLIRVHFPCVFISLCICIQLTILIPYLTFWIHVWVYLFLSRQFGQNFLSSNVYSLLIPQCEKLYCLSTFIFFNRIILQRHLTSGLPTVFVTTFSYFCFTSVGYSSFITGCCIADISL